MHGRMMVKFAGVTITGALLLGATPVAAHAAAADGQASASGVAIGIRAPGAGPVAPGWHGRSIHRLPLPVLTQERWEAIAARLGVSEQALKQAITEAQRLIARAHGMTLEEFKAAVGTGTVTPLTPTQRVGLRADIKKAFADAGVKLPARFLPKRAKRLGVSPKSLATFRKEARELIEAAYGMPIQEIVAALRTGTLPRLTPAQRATLIKQIRQMRAELGLPRPPVGGFARLSATRH